MASGPTIVAQFVADTSKMTSEVDKASTESGSRLKNFAKGAATALGGAFAVDKIVEFGKASVEAAAADAESQAKLATTIRNVTGATEGQIAANEKFIAGLSKQTAIADDDLRPAMDKLVRGFGSVEEAQKALSLATDVSAGTGKDLSTVTEAMMKAANGQTGALGRLGIQTKDAGGKALSLDQIMQNMSHTFKGQAAEAADSAAGKMRGAKVQFGEFQEQIGTLLLPILSQLAGVLADLFPIISKFAPVILPVAAAFGVWAAAVSVATTVQTAFGVSLSLSVGWIALIVVGIAALVAGIIWAWNNVGWFHDAVLAAFSGIKVAFGWIADAAKAVWNWISSNWPILLGVLAGPIGLAVAMIATHWDTVKAGASAVWQWIQRVWDGITNAISSSVRAIGGWIGTLVNWLRQPIGAATEVYNWVSGRFQALADFIGNIVGAISGAVGRIVSAIKVPINAVIGMWNNLEFTIPSFTLPSFDVGPVHLGGQHFGGSTIGFPDIPKLATGGILTSPTLFVGGEAGTEIVAPESMLRAIMREEGGGHYELNIYPRTADSADIAYGFRRLELLAGI